jgi:biotin carboxyl carrier protein
MRYVVSIGEQTLELDVVPRPEGGYVVRGPGGRESIVDPLAAQSGLVSLLVDGQALTVLPGQGELRLRGERYAARAQNWQHLSTSRERVAEGSDGGAISASMPGRIAAVLCEVGSQVSANGPVIVIEAMKMQNELCAKSDSTVRAVHVVVGQTVERGALLIEFE